MRDKLFEIGLLGMVVLIVLVFVIAAITGEWSPSDPRWECDMPNRTGWERERQYQGTEITNTYNHQTGRWEMKSKAVYEWVRVREMEEKEYAIHCLEQGGGS